jgi:hypothetical protein
MIRKGWVMEGEIEVVWVGKNTVKIGEVEYKIHWFDDQFSPSFLPWCAILFCSHNHGGNREEADTCIAEGYKAMRYWRENIWNLP